MNELVNAKLKEAKKAGSGKVVPLKEALQAVYARPNDDDMIVKIVSPLRRNLDELESWEKTISQLTDEALNALKNPRAFKPAVQVTYAIFLENLMSEIKPYMKNEGFERKIIERIRDSKVTLSKEANNELKLRMMKSMASPAEIAEHILTPAPETKSNETPPSGK